MKPGIIKGGTSIVQIIDSNRVIKKNFNQNDGSFQRELYWLKRFKESDHIPDLIDYNEQNQEIVLEHAGERLNCDNLPHDWTKQIDKIEKVLKENNCRHNDISLNELFVKDSKIMLIDFGYASQGHDLSCGGKFDIHQKTRVFRDDWLKNFINFEILQKYRDGEPNCLVLWDADERENIISDISDKFIIIREILYDPVFFQKKGKKRTEVLSEFYQGRISSHGEKGKKPFIVFFVIDPKPDYQVRENYFNGSKNIVNSNTFDLKIKTRKGRTSFFHCSDNIQEAYDNLESLSLYEENVPLNLWHSWRPEFPSVEAFFEHLEKENINYVVLRNYEELEDSSKESKIKGDIDLLVDDYFAFKRVSGAIGYKHKLPVTHKSAGPLVEQGGYKVAGRVSISGNEVSVDSRYIGDGYYCTAWEKDMLLTKVKHDFFFIPEKRHYFYSLLYHALVHKASFPPKYITKLQMLSEEIGLDIDMSKLDECWNALDKFMTEKSYEYVRPNELNIYFNARDRAGITLEDEVALIEEYINNKDYLSAKHLVDQCLKYYGSEENLIGLKKNIDSKLGLLPKEKTAPLSDSLFNRVKRGLKWQIRKLWIS